MLFLFSHSIVKIDSLFFIPSQTRNERSLFINEIPEREREWKKHTTTQHTYKTLIFKTIFQIKLPKNFIRTIFCWYSVFVVVVVVLLLMMVFLMLVVVTLLYMISGSRGQRQSQSHESYRIAFYR